MTGDLVSLRVLIVSGAMQDRETLRQGAGAVSVPIDILEAGTARAATGMLAAGGIDIVFIDSRIAAEERGALLGAIRALKPPPFVFCLITDRSEAVGLAEAKGDGICRHAYYARASQGVARTLQVGCGCQRRVLLVDDSATMRSIVRKILTASRFQLEVSDAEEGVDALKQIRAGQFDLVILDYHMPGLNGIETLSEIKREHGHVTVAS